MTFLDVAGTTAMPETAQRNRQNARKAYNAILRAIPKLVLSAAERQSIENDEGAYVEAWVWVPLKEEERGS